jgi:hypothetical protein
MMSTGPAPLKARDAITIRYSGEEGGRASVDEDDRVFVHRSP